MEEPHVDIKMNRVQESETFAKLRRKKIVEEEKKKQERG